MSDKTQVSIYHIAEQFLYEYFCNPGDYEIREENLAAKYLRRAKEKEANGQSRGAITDYLLAHEENPVDVSIYQELIRMYISQEDYTQALDLTKESYNFCCTRAELAAYYRELGCIEIQLYKPELAAALYRYSTYFSPSKAAEKELQFLTDAMKKEMGDMTPQQCQEILSKGNIPTGPNQVTLALLVKAGEEAEQMGDQEQALDCYQMVYDLTMDDEILGRIQALQM